jgi:hypothetical protein
MKIPTGNFPLSSRALDSIEDQIRDIRSDAIDHPRDGYGVARQIADLIHDARMAEFRAKTDRHAARTNRQLLSRRS